MNKNLSKLFSDDQHDRINPRFLGNWKEIMSRDRKRRILIHQMLRKKLLRTGKDFFMAAMIYQHGPSINDSLKAVMLSNRSAELGYRRAYSFYAACLDRLLIKQGKKQKYGTQYKIISNGKISLLPLQNRKKVDDYRKEAGLVTLDKYVRSIKSAR